MQEFITWATKLSEKATDTWYKGLRVINYIDQSKFLGAFLPLQLLVASKECKM